MGYGEQPGAEIGVSDIKQELALPWYGQRKLRFVDQYEEFFAAGEVEMAEKRNDLLLTRRKVVKFDFPAVVGSPFRADCEVEVRSVIFEFFAAHVVITDATKIDDLCFFCLQFLMKGH